jgi:hypothetical protein
MSWIDTVIAWDFFIAMAAPPVFVAVYLTMTWWKTWEGRVIMAKQVLFTGFLLNGVLYYALGPDYPGSDAFRLVLFTVMPIAFWGMTILLINARLQARREKLALAAQPPSPETRPLTDDHQLG